MPRNPYQYLGASGTGASPPGFGGNWYFGQGGGRGNIYSGLQGRSNYSGRGSYMPYTGGGAGSNYMGGQNFYYPGGGRSNHGSLNAMPSYPGMQGRMPIPPGKGMGSGGIGMPHGSMASSQAEAEWQQKYGPRSFEGRRQTMMGHYENLLQQRQLEEALGLSPSTYGWYQFNPLALHGFPQYQGQAYTGAV